MVGCQSPLSVSVLRKLSWAFRSFAMRYSSVEYRICCYLLGNIFAFVLWRNLAIGTNNALSNIDFTRNFL